MVPIHVYVHVHVRHTACLPPPPHISDFSEVHINYFMCVCMCVCHSVSMYSAATSNSHIFRVHCEVKCPFLALTYSVHVQTRSLYVYIVHMTILYCSSNTIYSQPINKALHVCTNVLASSHCSKYVTDFVCVC